MMANQIRRTIIAACRREISRRGIYCAASSARVLGNPTFLGLESKKDISDTFTAFWMSEPSKCVLLFDE
jgi:hypothetical protein